MGIANDMMEIVHEAQAVATFAVAQRDELADALRGVVGLIQLMLTDSYFTHEHRTAVAGNHRLIAAKELLAKLELRQP